jgi:hypothetical protein
MKGPGEGKAMGPTGAGPKVSVDLGASGRAVMWIIIVAVAAYLLANGGGIERFLGF